MGFAATVAHAVARVWYARPLHADSYLSVFTGAAHCSSVRHDAVPSQ